MALCMDNWGDCNQDYRDGCETPIKHRVYCDGDPRIQEERRTRAMVGVFVMGEGTGRGALDIGEFSAAIGPYRTGLHACYERALTSAPGLHGVWFYEFTVDEGGRFAAAKLVRAETRSPEVEACIAEYVASVHLDVRPLGGPVTFPCRLVFVAPRDDKN